jgi:chromate transporter
LFLVFFRAGMIFGGGTVIMTVLLKELVDRRRAISRADFLTLYGLARIIPSGSMTAHAVALGHYFAGLPGSIVALAGVSLPVLVPTFVLTALYEAVRGHPWLDLLPVTLLPAAVALLAGAVISVGREVARPSLDLAIAVAAVVAVLVLRANPGVVLVLAGILGALALGDKPAGPAK